MSVSEPLSGELNKRIELFSRVDIPSKELAAVSQDTTICKVWAKIEPTGSAYWLGSQTEQKATHRFWIRTIKGKTEPINIEHGVYVRFKDRAYMPVRVTDCNGRGRFTMIEAQELGIDRPEQGTPLGVMLDE